MAMKSQLHHERESDRRQALSTLRTCLGRVIRYMVRKTNGAAELEAAVAHEQSVFQHAHTQREPEILPYGMSNDFSRKTMAMIERITGRFGLAR